MISYHRYWIIGASSSKCHDNVCHIDLFFVEIVIDLGQTQIGARCIDSKEIKTTFLQVNIVLNIVANASDVVNLYERMHVFWVGCSATGKVTVRLIVSKQYFLS